ncbi:hypothetical protein CH063_12976 [Colletotrichum higginsianum]|uniref:Uncharacterized protein n=1 Tax=Colletotrichum higginsianum (strain IMI 349063) TaxID=759273 RepID=H1VSK5_COLHI|nr:hypothetical protein CH63R_01296 [Colletotrichum higginsianum IMI 349063]OBR16116.1 hypothetical protein CH63R_01296 [Colletotrichum higginsianum IMI 349063]CCF43213.1 hypothetical protein CH063_12976 [Colletotrichum higginsianum]
MASADAIEATKTMQQPHLQLAAKKKRLQLYYEIVLNVMDSLIDKADDPNVSIRWWVEYKYEPATKLSVEMDDAGMKPLKKRFNNIRAISQVDSRIRRLVHRRFPRVPLREGMVQGKPLAPIRAWIRADNDLFIPSFLTDLGQNGIAFHQSLTMPTPTGFEFIQHIEQIFLIGLALISDRTLQGIYRLPNLKAVTVDCLDLMPKGFVMHPGKLNIDGDAFPLLAEWHKSSQAFNEIWTPFFHCGVHLYACIRGAKKNPVAELFPTRKGIRLQCLHPNCTCCNYNNPTSSTTSQG